MRFDQTIEEKHGIDRPSPAPRGGSVGSFVKLLATTWLWPFVRSGDTPQRAPTYEEQDPLYVERDRLVSAHDCALVLEALPTNEGLTVHEIAERTTLTTRVVESALAQLRIDGCAERASWSSCWWAAR